MPSAGAEPQADRGESQPREYHMAMIAALLAPLAKDDLARHVGLAIRSAEERGAETVRVNATDGSALGIGSFDWELAPGLGNTLAFAQSESVMVAADASLYYQEDLRRQVDREDAPTASADYAALILAAYRRWGTACPSFLEGDFAFVLWDGEQKLLLAARDFGGTRPLFFTRCGAALWVASTIRSLTRIDGIDLGYNLLGLAEDAASLTSTVRDDTCYQAIRRLPAGYSLVARPGEDPTIEPHWQPPIFGADQYRGSFDAAAEELQAIIIAAVETRITEVERPAVWMSGGYDSTSVFSAGSAGGASITPVSVRYPRDDPGYEDPWIEETAERWNASVHWVDVESIPPLDRPLERAAERDEPFAHKFEMWNRALCRGARSAGSRVALGGNGGDQLFQVSPVYLADLFARVRWAELRSVWRRGFRGAGYRFFVRWAIQPNLPSPLLNLAALLRGGRPLVHYMEDRPPPWFRDEFIRGSGLGDRLAGRIERRPGEPWSSVETGWYFRAGFGAKINALVNSMGLSEGLQLRSPLYDGRLLQFVASLPRSWRSDAGEGKVILRKSMQGLVPTDVLATRRQRTGLPRGYLARCLQESLPEMINVAGRCSKLADLGIIEPAVLAEKCSVYLADSVANGALGGPVYDTLATELWLRSRT